LGETLAPASSLISTKPLRRPPPFRGDPWWNPAQDFCITAATDLDIPPASSPTPVMLLRGDLRECVHTDGSIDCGAPGGAAVKSSPGRAWSAARALPRHAGQVCTWTTGEHSFFSSPPSASLPGHGL
jgi:hypothetical protein